MDKKTKIIAGAGLVTLATGVTLGTTLLKAPVKVKETTQAKTELHTVTPNSNAELPLDNQESSSSSNLSSASSISDLSDGIGSINQDEVKQDTGSLDTTTWTGNMNISSISNGDFSSIQGYWFNDSASPSLRGMWIENDTMRFDGNTYRMYIENRNQENPYFYIGLTNIETGQTGPIIGLFPAGTTIPMSDGEIDPTDTSKDRILISWGLVSASDIQKNVFYNSMHD